MLQTAGIIRNHYVNMPSQTHGASYHGIFAILTGINAESFETFFHVNILYSVKRLQEIIFNAKLHSNI